MPPKQDYPAGFVGVQQMQTKTIFKSINQGTGGVSSTGKSHWAGTDGASPCLALYVPINADTGYVAHIDRGFGGNLTDANLSEIKKAVVIKWHAVVAANQHFVVSKDSKWFVGSGQGDAGPNRIFGRAVTEALAEEIGGQPMATQQALQNYTGFIVGNENQFPPQLISFTDNLVTKKWKAEEVAGTDNGWTLNKGAHAGTFVFN